MQSQPNTERQVGEFRQGMDKARQAKGRGEQIEQDRRGWVMQLMCKPSAKALPIDIAIMKKKHTNVDKWQTHIKSCKEQNSDTDT